MHLVFMCVICNAQIVFSFVYVWLNHCVQQRVSFIEVATYHDAHPACLRINPSEFGFTSYYRIIELCFCVQIEYNLKHTHSRNLYEKFFSGFNACVAVAGFKA